MQVVFTPGEKENFCCECGIVQKILVEVGQKPSPESATTWLCHMCCKDLLEFATRAIELHNFFVGLNADAKLPELVVRPVRLELAP